MDVGFIHPTHPASEGDGATYTATKLVTELVDREHDVTIFCLREPEGAQAGAIDASIRRVDTASRLPFNVAVNHALREHRSEFESFDVIHSYKTRALPAVSEIATAVSAGTVLSLTAYGAICPKNDLLYKDQTECHSNGYRRCAGCAMETAQTDGAGPAGALTRRLRWTGSRLLNLRQMKRSMDSLTAIDAYHSYTTHVKETYAEFGFPAKQISVVPNILDDRFVRDTPPRTEEPIRLLFVGRLEVAKGADRLVPILRRVRNRTERNVTLTIAGSGQLRSDIERQTANSDLERHVEFLGHVPYLDMPDVYGAHDVLLSPTVWEEPFGRIYLEALASGTPVVASDVGAAAEILGDGGILTDGGIAAMADAVVELLESNRLLALAQAATDELDRYRAESVVPQFEELYRSVA